MISVIVHHQEIEALPVLQGAVKCFWHTRLEFGATPSNFEVLPDGYAEIVFHFGTECSVVTPDGLQLLPSPYMMGLLGKPVVIQATQNIEVIAVKCYPWAVFELLGLPPANSGVYRFEHPISQLHATLQQWVDAGNIERALEELQHYFLQLHAQLPAQHMLHKAGNAMRIANGTLPVSAIAEAAHASIRTLERNFKQASGHTVKDVSGLIRFEQVRNQLFLHPDTGLAALAHELGYADQAHLTKEFKRYSGITPAVFAKKMRLVQETGGFDFVAFIQS